VYNDGVFNDFTDRKVAPDAQVLVEHGAPLIFGKELDKGLRFAPGGLALEVVRLGENGVTEADVLVHDETNRALAVMLADMEPPTHPMALGVLYCQPAPSFERQIAERVEIAVEKAVEAGSQGDLNALLRGGHTWRVEA
jgi:2-oxoglutarate ferredoxin oxidoreductase subunit beta